MFACACHRLRQLTFSAVRREVVVGYKSRVSLENLYPSSDQNFLRITERQQTYSSEAEEPFTGVVPVEKLDVKFVKGGGPGGQHVNTSSSKVEMRFNVDGASWIPDWIKPRLKEQMGPRLTKDGDLIVTSDKTRKQLLNRADCLAKIRQMIFIAAEKLPEPSQEELDNIAERKARAQREAIKQKRRRSEIKRYRSI